MSPKIDRTLSFSTSAGFVTGTFSAMACPCEVIVEVNSKKQTDVEHAHSVCHTVAQEAWRIEKKYSRYRSDSIIHQINSAHGQNIQVDQETVQLLDFATLCYQVSEGVFDITSGILGKVWKFDGSCNVPSQSAVNDLLPLIGWDKVIWKNPHIAMPEGMSLDFGGIGKEFAVDRSAQLVKQMSSQAVLINFGGDIYATQAPNSRSSWVVGIEPINKELTNQAPKISLKVGAIATSGDSRRFLRHNGKVLSHVLNPMTGWPVEQAPASVTVMAENCTQAGLFSTLAMLQGESAEEFLQAQQLKHWVQRRS